MQSQVQTQEVVEVLVLLAALAQQLREVLGPVQAAIEGLLADSVDLVGTEDQSGNTGNLGQQGDAVVKGGLPVLGLVETLLIGLGKLGLGVEGGHGHRQLGHGVHVAGEGLDEVQDVLGEVGLFSQLLGKGADLTGGGNLAGQKQPEHGLGEHLSARGALGELLLAVLDGLAVEADTLIGIQDGALPEHGLETTHTTENIANLDLANGLVTLVLDLFEQFAFGGDDVFEGGLEVGFGGGITPEEAELAGGLQLLELRIATEKRRA